MIHDKYIPTSIPKALESCDDIHNLIRFLQTASEIEISKPDDIIDEILETVSKLKPTNQIEFIKEQIRLLKYHPNGPRFSNNLLAMCVLWQQSSSACYRLILSSGVLVFPCERTIRRLASGITTDLDLAASAISYLKARKSKLQKKDLLVNLVMDEVD